jgi:hypothetical protein
VSKFFGNSFSQKNPNQWKVDDRSAAPRLSLPQDKNLEIFESVEEEERFVL